MRATILFATIFFTLLFFLSSCNVLNYADRRAEHAYRRLGGEPRQVQVGNTLLQYRLLGRRGDPILLIHGFGPNPKMQWLKQIKPLTREHRLIVPDLVYFGGSRPLTERQVYSPEFQADQLRLLLDTLGINQVHLLGLSYGGLVASLFYVKNQDRVDRIILSDALTKFYTRAYADSLALSRGRPSAADLLLPETGQDLEILLRTALYQPPKLKPAWRDSMVQRYYNPNRSHLRELLHYLYRSESFLNSLVYKTDRPVLLIWGEHDNLVPVEVESRAQP